MHTLAATNSVAGVRRYMQAHAFGNTVDSDLWSLMQRAVGKPILAICALRCG
jgi:aminopeptidase N